MTEMGFAPQAIADLLSAVRGHESAPPASGSAVNRALFVAIESQAPGWADPRCLRLGQSDDL